MLTYRSAHTGNVSNLTPQNIIYEMRNQQRVRFDRDMPDRLEALGFRDSICKHQK